MKRRLLPLLLFAMLLPGTLIAKQLAGVEIPEQISIDGVEDALVLNGAGVRKKFFVSVYVGALYLPQPQHGVGSLLREPPANRVLMHFVYSEVAKRKMDQAWREGFENNLSAPQYAEMRPRLERLVALFGDMKEGDRVWLDHVPGTGTRVSVNAEPVGQIEGSDFNAALLAVWLGREPVTAALKKAMVGVDKP
jgi:hypothetical protein